MMLCKYCLYNYGHIINKNKIKICIEHVWNKNDSLRNARCM